MLERSVALRVLAWQEEEFLERQDPFDNSSAKADACVDCDQRHRQIGGVSGGAMPACSQNGVKAVLAVNRAAARARLPLVAGQGGAAKIIAPRALEQVSADRRSVANLRR